ncbi:hypothetical protein RLIN73S_04305 [Rhodanobacter lindaniclasticus]
MSELILQTACIGKGGEIFALDMGEPIRIRDLAEQMIRLAGRKPGSEIPIVYTGLRAGEKLFEELFHPLENYSATAHAKSFWRNIAKCRGNCCRLCCTRPPRRLTFSTKPPPLRVQSAAFVPLERIGTAGQRGVDSSCQPGDQ